MVPATDNNLAARSPPFFTAVLTVFNKLLPNSSQLILSVKDLSAVIAPPKKPQKALDMEVINLCPSPLSPKKELNVEASDSPTFSQSISS